MLRLVDQRTHLGLRVEGIADADRLGAPGKAVEETLVDAVLDEDARAVGADLAGRVEIAQHGAADGVLHVGVIEHDQRRLAAEFHRCVFHVRAGEGQHLLARRHRSGERHLGDDRMGGECGADGAVALDDIEEPIRQACLGVDLGERQRRERRVFRWLEDHGVAHGQRRRRLPACALDRIVPRADADADAERLAARIGEGPAEIDVIAVEGCHGAAEEFQRIRGRGRVGDQRLLDGLAGVEGLQPRQFVVACPKDVGRAPQDAAALDRLQPRPGGLRGARRLDGQLDDVVGRGVEACDRFAGRRVDDRQRIAALVFDVASVDVVGGLRLSSHGSSHAHWKWLRTCANTQFRLRGLLVNSVESSTRPTGAPNAA